MADLTLNTHTRHVGAIVDIIAQSRADGDSRAFVLTPSGPIPDRRIVYDDPNRRYDDYSSARWVQDGPTFERVKRVANWGWLRRIACGYSEPSLYHGTAFYVRQWRYAPSNGRMPVPHERFAPILIARLSDGRYFADQWADPSVLYDALDRWRNASGYVCQWQGIGFDVTGAIGGLDWKTIPDRLNKTR